MSYRILLIDDEPDLRASIRDFLEDFEFTVVEASNGREGLEKFKENRPNAIITDLLMPEMPGLELVERLSVSDPHVPIIVLSGVNDISDALGAIRKGAWDYLVKPIRDLELLLHVLSRSLERAEMLRSRESYKHELEEEVERRTHELERVNVSLKVELEKRQLAELDLAKSHELLRRVIDRQENLIYITTREQVLLMANKALCDFLGSTPEKLQGSGWKKFLDSNIPLPTELAKLSTTLVESGNDSIETELSTLNREGESREFTVYKAWMTMQQGEKPVILTVARDITEKKRIEQARRETAELIERTSKIASIGVMAGGITHEIAQPLNGILLNADTLTLTMRQEELKRPESVLKLIDNIRKGAHRINSIVQHMRDVWITPIQTELADVDLHKIVETVLSLHNQQLRNHMVEIELLLDPENPLVRANELQLEQVLVNLITNALFALDETDKNERSLTLKSWIEKDWVNFEIRDSGMGLPELANMDSLFDPFFSTRKSGKGTGLGLAIVHSFMRRFGGEIEAKNNPDRGASFTLKLKYAGNRTNEKSAEA